MQRRQRATSREARIARLIPMNVKLMPLCSCLQERVPSDISRFFERCVAPPQQRSGRVVAVASGRWPRRWVFSGNKRFAGKQYDQAISEYTKAIGLADPTDPEVAKYLLFMGLAQNGGAATVLAVATPCTPRARARTAQAYPTGSLAHYGCNPREQTASTVTATTTALIRCW